MIQMCCVIITILYYCTEMSTETWTHVTVRRLPVETCPESVEVFTIARSTCVHVCVCVGVCSVLVCSVCLYFIFICLFTVYADIQLYIHTTVHNGGGRESVKLCYTL